MKNSLTKTRWTGRSSSSASAAPMRNSPAGIRARFGEGAVVIQKDASIVQYSDQVMRLESFAMERMQSTYENHVTWNLSESGVHPLSLGELVDDDAAREALMADALHAVVSPRTKLIIICNPSNPTGARFEARDLDRVAAAAARHGSWILSDEIYRGAERDGRETPTIWGRSDRAIVTSGLSKAYGLPGLRIGWIVGPPATVATLWSYHDYTTISPGALSDFLARRALAPSHRARILARTRTILNEN